MRYDYNEAASYELPACISSELARSIDRPFEVCGLLNGLVRLSDNFGVHGFSIRLPKTDTLHLSVSLYWCEGDTYSFVFMVGSSASGFGAEGREVGRVTSHREVMFRIWRNIVEAPKLLKKH